MATAKLYIPGTDRSQIETLVILQPPPVPSLPPKDTQVGRPTLRSVSLGHKVLLYVTPRPQERFNI